MNRFKKYIGVLLLTIFVSLKLVSLHEFTHTDEHDDDCEICEYVISLNTTPFTAIENISVENFILHNYNKQLFYEYTYKFAQNLVNTTLFCRPPPSL